MTTATPSPLYEIPPFPVWRFSVAQYQRMIEIGMLKEQERSELLDGWITTRPPHTPAHDAHLAQVNAVLLGLLPAGWHVRAQSAVILSASVPQPDFAVVGGGVQQYCTQHPGPAAIALLIEVADSSLDHDRNVKGPIYASAGIGTYWIANLVDLILEVYTSPAQGGYQNRQDYTVNEVVPLVVAGQVSQVPVADLIG